MAAEGRMRMGGGLSLFFLAPRVSEKSPSSFARSRAMAAGSATFFGLVFGADPKMSSMSDACDGSDGRGGGEARARVSVRHSEACVALACLGIALAAAMVGPGAGVLDTGACSYQREA